MPTTAHSQLMTNHVPGAALTAQQRIRTVYSDTHSPLLFSLDSKAKFSLTLPSATSTTGWHQLDLNAQLAHLPELGSNPAVHSFAVSQDSDGSVWVVLAAAARPGGASRVYVSKQMTNRESTSDWSELGAGLTHRPIPDGLMVTDIAVGRGEGDTPFSVVAAMDEHGQVRYHQINPDPAGSWSSMPVPLPQNATKCRAVAVGHHAELGQGVYSLFELGTLRSLVFSTLPTMDGDRTVIDTVRLDLPEELNAQTLATHATPKGPTDLYVGGDGVHRFSVESQLESHKPSEALLDATHVTGVRELVVATDQNNQQISLWATDSRDTLMYVEGSRPAEKHDYTWQSPLLLDTEVTALGAFRVLTNSEHPRSSVAMAVGGSDGSFRMVAQDPQTALWQHQTVSLHTSNEVIALQTYTTRVVVTDDAGEPLRQKEISIEPDRDCAALINGRYYALRAGTAKPATTDFSGVVTVVLETTDLTAPSYTFHVDGAMTTADPGTETKDKLRNITESTIANAVRSDGKPLFGKVPDRKTRTAAANAVGQLMAAHDKLSGVAPRFAVAQQDSLRGDWLDSLTVQAGDLLTSLRNFDVRDFLIREAEAGWEFLVKIGEQAYRCLLDVAHKAIAAIDWVLKRTLGITLEDMVSWLGFAFNWDDILTNHRVLAKIVTLSFDQMIDEMARSKKTVDDWFTKLRASFVDDKLVVDKSADIFAERVGRGKSPVSADHQQAADAPQTSWGQHQLDTNIPRATPGEYKPTELGKVLTSLALDEVLVLQQVGRQIQDLFGEGLADKSFADVVDAVMEIVGLAVVDTLENVTLTVIDVGIVVVSVIKSILTARWDIPVLTPLYEKVICRGDGSQLSLIDVFCLLGAIPATVVGKKVLPGRQNLFTPYQATAVSKAKNWDQLMVALSTRQPPKLTRAAATTDDVVIAAGILQLINSFLRLANTAMGALVDNNRGQAGSAGPIPVGTDTVIRRVRIGLDWIGYVFGLASTFLLRPPKPTPRQNIDITMAALGFIPAATASVQEYIRTASKTPGFELTGLDSMLPGGGVVAPANTVVPPGADISVADALVYVDSVCGLLVLVLSSYSVSMQWSEKPAGSLDPTRQGALLILKTGQNMTAGLAMLHGMLLARPANEEPQVKAYAVAARLLLNGARAYMQVGRSIAQLVDLFVDFEGVIP